MNSERIFITAGGIGDRLELIKGIPKSLAELPDHQSVLKRQQGQLETATDIPVTICTGYRRDLMQHFFYDQCVTYDYFKPQGLLGCIKQVMAEYDLDSYTFVLGDTIWHPKALKQALKNRHKDVISCYGNRHRNPCETYMLTISGRGVKIIKDVLDNEIFVMPLNRDFTVQTGKWWLLEKWGKETKQSFERKIYRMNATHPVDDFDIDSQYLEVWQNYRNGVYDD